MSHSVPRPGRRSSLPEIAVRGLVWSWLVAWVVWQVYLFAMFRTMDYGMTSLSLLPGAAGFSCLFAAVPLLPALVVLWGRRRAVLRYLLLCFVVGVGSLAVAEAYAGIEEAAFRRECRAAPAGTETLSRGRWWPFESSFLACRPNEGVFYGGD